MEQDLTAFLQEMRRRMEAMQAEIETLRAERDAARGAQANHPSSARAQSPPIVEMSETKPDSEEDTDLIPDNYYHGEEQCEPGSQRTANRPALAGRARALHPFTAAIMEEQIPERAFPVLEKYDGSGDPEEHLRSFVDAMTIYLPRENVWCRVFLLSIKGEALAWFHSLRPRTINNFATLRDMFERQFSAGRARNLTYMELTNIKQEKGESLKDFMDRFNRTARTRVNPGRIAREGRSVHQNRRNEGGPEAIARAKREFRAGEKGGQETVRTGRAVEGPEVRPSRSSPKADGTKHCTYHLNIGHNTEDCTVLKDKVEELIRAGHLRKFVKEERKTRSPPRRTRIERSDRREDRRPDRRRSRSRSHDRSLRGTINTILGGFAGGSSRPQGRET
ncbi:uncharacterized protein LOC124837239 [Vigna umbellata]|uniref:uncharacterized protein LOC124837239 n=1 Tax=Vigna umbellata TaxID=87088 RepID=UPI001F5F4D30|nr:uncharacterized protein LOC124837239 [Vigna umbellata]